MPMSKGQKIVAPFLRATSSSNIIHAVENLGMRKDDPKAERTVCGKRTTGPDQPAKRFQSGMENVCTTCYSRVVQARIDKIHERKTAYNKAQAEKARQRKMVNA